MNREFLATEVDKQGNSVEIYRVEKISMSPIYTFFLRHIAELIDNGHAYPVTSWDDDCSAIYAEKDGEVLGHIVYDVKKKDVMWITLSAVAKEHRGKGIYTLLHGHLEKTAKDLNFSIISSHIHVKNTARLKSAEQVGMKPVYYYMAKKI
jgi:GNAT superfamily N-acetyltransferase